ncbi:type VI secretion system tube protein Hcp [Paraburkholderia sp. DHOC27]|uniref:type VI secretion system tube protein Hcp n=1 Tax=Paraburkholderia sp. DHOC27 TaxID=2303330 RepID=UPI000E3BC9A2|nr:type VI secretion system tube protein Hcp [Paraburkholderia sp. DHOC27]RFU48316.1 Hcp1 family type VI secretion system effector [Paraburkholderia sp. DHOC27]
MPSPDVSPPFVTSRLSLDYARQFDTLALATTDDMLLQVVPKRSNSPVKGEAPARADWDTPMQIHGWRWAEGYETHHAGHALNASDMRVADLGVVKIVDSASPAIAKLCAQAELLALAHIKCFKAGGAAQGGQIEFLSLKLEEAYIRSYQIYTSVRLGCLCEVFEFSAQKLTMTAATQKETGARGADVTFPLDVMTRRIT